MGATIVPSQYIILRYKTTAHSSTILSRRWKHAVEMRRSPGPVHNVLEDFTLHHWHSPEPASMFSMLFAFI
jgi:hypothetical protein